MISFEEYKSYYLELISTALGVREDELDLKGVDINKKKEYFNYSLGLKILYFVSFIESNFLSKQEFKRLRNFELIPDLKFEICQVHLSCFIYIRDCIAHSPKLELLPLGVNTSSFINVINNGGFNLAQIEDKKVIINPRSIHYFYLMIRSIYQ